MCGRERVNLEVHNRLCQNFMNVQTERERVILEVNTRLKQKFISIHTHTEGWRGGRDRDRHTERQRPERGRDLHQIWFAARWSRLWRWRMSTKPPQPSDLNWLMAWLTARTNKYENKYQMSVSSKLKQTVPPKQMSGHPFCCATFFHFGSFCHQLQMMSNYFDALPARFVTRPEITVMVDWA